MWHILDQSNGESTMEPIEMTVLRIVCSALFIWGAVELFIKLVNGPKKKPMATKNKVENGSDNGSEN
jgi:hypothetical protein